MTVSRVVRKGRSLPAVGAVALAPLSAQEAPRGVHLFQVHLNVLAWLDRSGIEKHVSQCCL
jgi:hypothetical protein